ncbi:MAG: hypothetical protein HQM12_09290 [SAR324 cluster bacterium]|nr:hypothetical protein [SAR324 cluster bacterium]
MAEKSFKTGDFLTDRICEILALHTGFTFTEICECYVQLNSLDQLRKVIQIAQHKELSLQSVIDQGLLNGDVDAIVSRKRSSGSDKASISVGLNINLGNRVKSNS